MSNNQKIKKSTWIGWFLEQKKDINRKASEISKTENWNSVNSSGLMLISCFWQMYSGNFRADIREIWVRGSMEVYVFPTFCKSKNLFKLLHNQKFGKKKKRSSE